MIGTKADPSSKNRPIFIGKSISENRTDSRSQDREIGRFLVSLSTDRMEVPNRSGIQKGWDRTDRNTQFIGSVRIGNRFWTDRMPALCRSQTPARKRNHDQ